MQIPDPLIPVLLDLCLAGGRSYFVGGCVRDSLLGVTPKDYDVEVFGLDQDRFTEVLRRHGKVSEVGESFAIHILTIDGVKYDFSLPRREKKVADGHRGFEIEFDPNMSVEEAASRRDFTINSIMYDVANSQYIDNYGGREDLERRLLRHTSTAEKFVEDELRVLRGFQFAGRFDMTVDEETADICYYLIFDYQHLPKERVFAEWCKWAEMSTRPSSGLRFLENTGWLDVFPAIQALKGCYQDPSWHPEGWVATEIEGENLLSLPFQSCVTRPTKPFGVERTHSLRKFLTGTITTTTRTLSTDLTSGLSPTVKAESESLVWTFGRPAMTADEVIRVMLKVPKPSMMAVVNPAINDLQIVEAIVRPASIYMMNMLGFLQPSTNLEFHQESVEANSSVATGPTGVSIPIVVVDASSTAVDGDIVYYFDIAVEGNVHSDNSKKEGLSEPCAITPTRAFSLTIGDVFEHTLHVCDAMANVCEREGITGEDRIVLMLAALCHDFGKPDTTVFERDHWRSPGHADVGARIAEFFLGTIGAYPRIIKRVLPLVREHMVGCCDPGDITPRMVRRLIVRLESVKLQELVHLMEADNSGRPPLPAGIPEGALKIKEVSMNLNIPNPDKIEPILKGRDLLKLGWKPGKLMGSVLKDAFQAQLDGHFSTLEEALKWVEDNQYDPARCSDIPEQAERQDTT